MRRAVLPLVFACIVVSIAVQRIGIERARGTLAGLVRSARSLPGGVDDTRSLSELCIAAGVAHPPPDVRFVVHKSARTLELLSGDKTLARYRVGLGFAPSGEKNHEGDGRTPEGELTIVTRNEKSRFHRFLGLNYPRPRDVRSGITREESTAIAVAFNDGKQPPWNTPLGGAVGIHGHGSERDWTSGCVAVDDRVIDVLWEAAPLGTRVLVLP